MQISFAAETGMWHPYIDWLYGMEDRERRSLSYSERARFVPHVQIDFFFAIDFSLLIVLFIISKTPAKADKKTWIAFIFFEIVACIGFVLLNNFFLDSFIAF